MAKIRHIAYRVDDAEKMAQFMIDAFEMTIAQRRGEGVIDLTDGVINVSLLPMGLPGAVAGRGLEHIGFTAPDNDEAIRRVLAAGAKEKTTIQLGNAHYEKKFEGPEGIVVDVGDWAGAAPVDGA